MDRSMKERFLERWGRYFGGADLPIAFWYADDPGATDGAPVAPAKGHRCLFADLSRVRQGHDLRFDAATVGCQGGRRYLGFTREVAPDFAYFLSCGSPGGREGERYKKSPELVREYEKRVPDFDAPSRYAVFKRFDRLADGDDPAVVIFFAPPDVLSGLFTLANYAEAELDGVICPFGAGCGSIAKYPFLENSAPRPRAVLGTFDVSARPYVGGTELTFAVPMRKFESMVDDMDESFLATKSWKAIRQRLG